MVDNNNAAVSTEILTQFDLLIKKSGMQVNDLLKVLAIAYDYSLKEEIISELTIARKNYCDSFTS